MKASIAAAALLLAASVCGPAVAQEPLDDALALLQTDAAAGLAALEALAADGDFEAMNAVASMIEEPADGRPADPARALRLWERAAEGGSSAARLNLGSRLLLNDDPADDERAAAMLVKLEDGPLADLVAYPLGRAYLFGQGVEQNLERGSRLMGMAAEVEPQNIEVRYLLGRAHLNGWGVPVDDAAAYRHLKVAADGGDARAQWNVGMLLLNGEGVDADPSRARDYVRRSAEGDYVAGMVSMAVMLALGQGGEADPAEARHWYFRAAEAGSAHALRGLGAMLLTGEGGPMDAATGAAYLDLAAQGGDERAPELQQRFAREIAAAKPDAVEAVKAKWLHQHGMPR